MTEKIKPVVKKNKKEALKKLKRTGQEVFSKFGLKEGMKLRNYTAYVRTFACTYVRTADGDVGDLCVKYFVPHYRSDVYIQQF